MRPLWHRVIEPLRRSPWLAYLAFLVLASTVMVGRSPIRFLDSDLWIHLSGGRYLLEHHAVPRESFFSFISPPREWLSYAWLFQGILYLLYTWLGYYGPILLRTAMYFMLVITVCRFLFSRTPPTSMRSPSFSRVGPAIGVPLTLGTRSPRPR